MKVNYKIHKNKHIVFSIVFFIFFSHVCSAAVIRYDFTFSPNGGLGTGHPSILDRPDLWSGYFEYDTNSVTTTTGAGWLNHQFDVGSAALSINFGEAIVTVDDVSIHENTNFGEISFSGKLSDGFIVLPTLPDDRFQEVWVMDRFYVNFIFDRWWGVEDYTRIIADESAISARIVTSGVNGWSWQTSGDVEMTQGYAAVATVPLPPAMLLFISGIIVLASKAFRITQS